MYLLLSKSVDEIPQHTHKTTIANAGAHTHAIRNCSNPVTAAQWNNQGGREIDGQGMNGYTAVDVNTASNGSHAHTTTVQSIGSGQSHNNIPPYIVCYIFRRTA